MQTAWFIAIALLWALYLVLEGFDFGVGMLLRRVRGDAFDRRVGHPHDRPDLGRQRGLARDRRRRHVRRLPRLVRGLGVDLLPAPDGRLLALIARNTSIELLGKRDDEAWRRGWERVLFVASFVAPFCWGLIWTAALDGVALRGSEAAGGPLEVLTPVALLGGLTLVVLCRALGAAFLALRTEGEVGVRAARELRRTAPVAAVLVSATVIVTTPPGIASTLAILAALAFATLADCDRAARRVLAGRATAARISPPAGRRSRPGALRSRSSSSGGSPRCTPPGSTAPTARPGSRSTGSSRATTR